MSLKLINSENRLKRSKHSPCFRFFILAVSTACSGQVCLLHAMATGPARKGTAGYIYLDGKYLVTQDTHSLVDDGGTVAVQRYDRMLTKTAMLIL